MENMLAELELGVTTTAVAKDLMSHDNIVAKQMYYNPREQQAIERLTNLLQPARFAEVRADLVKKGFRSGFACIFHGAPGTGKTETVLQIARATGRDIMQVNISEIKSMWVGESEKNIKQIFSRYRKLVEESEVAPILLFNEADAIIGKRLENVTRSVDKMENSMQNIILEEIERLDGILIATTNLTCNMDKAFERRFLYKVEFERPTMEAKCAIWKSMIEGLNDDDAKALATKYNFSGGQIENIARKSVVDRILTGEELSLEALYGHCDAEFLDRKTTTKIGY
jgi:SpoVK/Ycf46/Vps4 family AAA+-type ATPase